MKVIYTPLRLFLVIGSCHLALPIATCQNLAPNPSFEIYDPCPTTFGNGGALECAPWQNGNLATSDYFNVCAVGTDVWIPDNLMGSQTAHTGSAYVGCFMRESSIWREYVQAPLSEPLLAGYTYQVSFYVSLADLYCAVENIGAYLSVNPPPGNNIGTPGVTPQIEANLGFITENEDWVLITGCFTAQGGEQWITIGNFYNNANTPLDPGCSISFASYYYIDDVSVVQGESAGNLSLELGDPVSTCTPYEIDPGVADVTYLWSNGSSDPTLVVTTSGTYALTITSGCDQAIDSVEVIFEGVAGPVDIGPAEVGICAGDSYTITLDPDDGEYLWQDGSTDPEYTITIPGVYSVTLDDGCDVTTDAITVDVIAAPDPFSLGPDVSLCNGDEIVFSFDPELGTFLWQDGSITPTYTVTTTGTYALTISNACGSASDEINVTSGVAPMVDLGPQQMTLCEGESLTINLDPEEGDYVWQDGSTSASYTISTAGNYAVTVSNGCGSGSDNITIALNEAPALFSLGSDTLICSGDEVVYSFDPGLGNFEWQDGSTASMYTITSAGIYSLTISNNCGEVTDGIVVTEMSSPEIDLGPPQVMLCEGQQIDFAFDPDLGDFLWQDGSTSSSYTITQPGIVEVSVTNGCGTASDQLEIVLVSSPVVDLGQDLGLCPQQLPITLIAGDPGSAAFLWQDGTTNNELVVTVSGTYAVTVSNTCFSVSDQVIVTVQSGSPHVVLLPDQVLCEGETIELNVQGVPGDYMWQDGSSSSTFVVNTPGMYAVTVTNQCGSGSDSISVTYVDSIGSPDLGADVSLCPGESYTFFAGVPDAVYTWQDGSTADSLVAALPGTYILQVSNLCFTASDTVEVVINGNPPDVELPSSIFLCEGNTVHLDAGIAGVSYIWSTGSQEQSIAVSSPGWYSVTVSSSCGADSDSVIVVDGGEMPLVSLPDSITICSGDTIELLPVTSGTVLWLWQDGSTAPTYTVNQPGVVAVQVSNACGVSADSVEVIMLSPIPSFTLGADTSICDGVLLTLEVIVPDVNVTWGDGSNAPTFIVTTSGPVIANISNQCGAAADTIDVTVLPLIPDLDLGSDQSLCPGESILFQPGVNGVSYLWHDGSTADSFLVAVPQQIILTLSNACGTASDTVDIVEDTNGPSLDLGPDIIGCQGELFTIHSSIGGVEYLWQDGSTSPDFTTSTAGVYILQVSNACGSDADTIELILNKTLPVVELGLDTTLCVGDELTLDVLIEAGTTIQWQDGSTGAEMHVAAPGTYLVTAENECGVDVDSIAVAYLDAPAAFELGQDTVICLGATLVLQAPSTSDQLNWQDGSHQTTMTAGSEQLYSLEISNACGSVYDDIAIAIDDKMPVIQLDPVYHLCTGEQITLSVEQGFDASYAWTTGETVAAISIDAPGQYGVSVTTTCFESSAAFEMVTDDCEESIFIPNIFSPNGDQVNDEFAIQMDNREITSFRFSIFDRWGNLVAYSEDSKYAWDGSFHQKPVEAGVFTYLITMDWKEGGKQRQQQFAGDVTVVR